MPVVQGLCCTDVIRQKRIDCFLLPEACFYRCGLFGWVLAADQNTAQEKHLLSWKYLNELRIGGISHTHTHTYTDSLASLLNTPKPKWSHPFLQPYFYDLVGISVSCVTSFLAYLYDLSSAAAFFPEQTTLSFCQDPEVQLNPEPLQHALVLPVDTHFREVQGVESFRKSLSVCLHVC